MINDDLRVAERLRMGMEGCVTDLRMRPSMISGTLRRHRRRRLRRRAALFGGIVTVAAGTAAGLASAPAVFGAHQVSPSFRLTASYVIARTAHSLGTGTGGSIAEVRGTGPGSLRWIRWYDQTTSRSTIEWFNQSGQLKNEAVLLPQGRTFHVTYINFPQKSWVRYTYSRPIVPSGGQEFRSLPFDRAGFQAAIVAGKAVIVGYQRVDGTDTIELRITAAATAPDRLTYMWIGRATYLPVRISIASTDPHRVVSEDITWLERSQRNLSRFTASIPAGFLQVQHSLPGGSGGGEG